MIRFHSKVHRVNEMGGKFYVETKVKAFEPGNEAAVIDTCEVKIFETEKQVSDFIGRG